MSSHGIKGKQLAPSQGNRLIILVFMLNLWCIILPIKVIKGRQDLFEESSAHSQNICFVRVVRFQLRERECSGFMSSRLQLHGDSSSNSATIKKTEDVTNVVGNLSLYADDFSL